MSGLLAIPTNAMPKARIVEHRREFYAGRVWDNVANEYLPKGHPNATIVQENALVKMGLQGHLVKLAKLGDSRHHVLVAPGDLDDARVGSVGLA